MESQVGNFTTLEKDKRKPPCSYSGALQPRMDEDRNEQQQFSDEHQPLSREDESAPDQNQLTAREPESASDEHQPTPHEPNSASEKNQNSSTSPREWDYLDDKITKAEERRKNFLFYLVLLMTLTLFLMLMSTVIWGDDEVIKRLDSIKYLLIPLVMVPFLSLVNGYFPILKVFKQILHNMFFKEKKK